MDHIYMTSTSTAATWEYLQNRVTVLILANGQKKMLEAAPRGICQAHCVRFKVTTTLSAL